MIKLFYGIGVAVTVGDRTKTGAKLTVELAPPGGIMTFSSSNRRPY
jgi:hypothetical protein